MHSGLLHRWRPASWWRLFRSRRSPQGRGRPADPSLPAGSPFLRGVPDPSASAEPSLVDLGMLIRRALYYNLGAIEAESEMKQATGNAGKPLSASCCRTSAPRCRGPGSRPISRRSDFHSGPAFRPWWARITCSSACLAVTQTVFDLSAIDQARSESHNVAAAGHSYRSARETVVLVTANLYLQTLASAARAKTSRAQLATAEALYTQAQDLKEGGIIAGIDVIRADVRLRTDRQWRTAAENDFEKAKLQLARVMGLPLGQVYSLKRSASGAGSGNYVLTRSRARIATVRIFSRRRKGWRAAEARRLCAG